MRGAARKNGILPHLRLCKLPVFNATGPFRVTSSPRKEHLRAVRWLRQEGEGMALLPQLTGSSRIDVLRPSVVRSASRRGPAAVR